MAFNNFNEAIKNKDFWVEQRLKDMGEEAPGNNLASTECLRARAEWEWDRACCITKNTSSPQLLPVPEKIMARLQDEWNAALKNNSTPSAAIKNLKKQVFENELRDCINNKARSATTLIKVSEKSIPSTNENKIEQHPVITSESTSVPKICALVDYNALFLSNMERNGVLIDALKNNGITDIYLINPPPLFHSIDNVLKTIIWLAAQEQLTVNGVDRKILQTLAETLPPSESFNNKLKLLLQQPIQNKDESFFKSLAAIKGNYGAYIVVDTGLQQDEEEDDDKNISKIPQNTPEITQTQYETFQGFEEIANTYHLPAIAYTPTLDPRQAKKELAIKYHKEILNFKIEFLKEIPQYRPFAEEIEKATEKYATKNLDQQKYFFENLAKMLAMLTLYHQPNANDKEQALTALVDLGNLSLGSSERKILVSYYEHIIAATITKLKKLPNQPNNSHKEFAASLETAIKSWKTTDFEQQRICLLKNTIAMLEIVTGDNDCKKEQKAKALTDFENQQKIVLVDSAWGKSYPVIVTIICCGIGFILGVTVGALAGGLIGLATGSFTGPGAIVTTALGAISGAAAGGKLALSCYRHFFKSTAAEKAADDLKSKASAFVGLKEADLKEETESAGIKVVGPPPPHA